MHICIYIYSMHTQLCMTLLLPNIPCIKPITRACILMLERQWAHRAPCSGGLQGFFALFGAQALQNTSCKPRICHQYARLQPLPAKKRHVGRSRNSGPFRVKDYVTAPNNYGVPTRNPRFGNCPRVCLAAVACRNTQYSGFTSHRPSEATKPPKNKNNARNTKHFRFQRCAIPKKNMCPRVGYE